MVLYSLCLIYIQYGVVFDMVYAVIAYYLVRLLQYVDLPRYNTSLGIYPDSSTNMIPVWGCDWLVFAVIAVCLGSLFRDPIQ